MRSDKLWYGCVSAAAALTLSATLMISGCETTGEVTANEGSGGSAAAAALVAGGAGGAELWAENCMRCHNVRKPTSFSDAQWETIMHHMRVRANLTVDEHTKILAFLQASN